MISLSLLVGFVLVAVLCIIEIIIIGELEDRVDSLSNRNSRIDRLYQEKLDEQKVKYRVLQQKLDSICSEYNDFRHDHITRHKEDLARVADSRKKAISQLEVKLNKLHALYLKHSTPHNKNRCPICHRYLSKGMVCKKHGKQTPVILPVTPLVDQVTDIEPIDAQETSVDPAIELPLRNLIAQARDEGKNIRCYYQNLIFTPDKLTSLLAEGKFQWWNIWNWELTALDQNYETPKSPDVTKLQNGVNA